MTSPEPCARCGGDAELDIASLWLCIECYHIAGSTCAGIGRLPATGTGPSPAASPTSASAAVRGDADQVC